MLATDNTQRSPWWRAPKNDVHGDLWGTVDRLDQDQQETAVRDRRHLHAYTARNITGLAASQVSAISDVSGIPREVTYNVTRVCIKTVLSTVSTTRPRPQFLTEKGRWEQKIRSMKLERFVSGIYDQSRVYEEAGRALLDACWSGTGILKVYAEDGRVKVERVYKPDMLVDEEAAWQGKTNVLYQRLHLSVDAVAARYGVKPEEVRSYGSSPRITNAKTPLDYVELIEAWHLPSRAGGKDGRHVIALRGKTLRDLKWEETDFPFVFIYYDREPIWFWGTGLAEELEGIQNEINETAAKISRAIRLLSCAKILKPIDCDIPDDWFTDEDGIILPYKGQQPPALYTPNAVNAEVFSYLENLFAKAYQIARISQMAASALKPEGLTSGKAIRAFTDVQTQAFAPIERQWEQVLGVKLARKVIAVARQIYASMDKGEDIEEKPDFEVRVPGRKYIESIKWSDVNLEEDDFVIQVWPVGSLPKTPSGKLATIQEMMGSGLISDTVTAQALLDFPDLEQYANLERAKFDDIHWTMDKILYEGEYVEPEEFQALELGIGWAQAYWLMARTEGAPEERQEMLVRWIKEAKGLLDAAKEQEQLAAQGANAPALIPGMPAVKSQPPPVASGAAGVPPSIAAGAA